jgi:hypothetical protein
MPDDIAILRRQTATLTDAAMIASTRGRTYLATELRLLASALTVEADKRAADREYVSAETATCTCDSRPGGQHRPWCARYGLSWAGYMTTELSTRGSCGARRPLSGPTNTLHDEHICLKPVGHPGDHRCWACIEGWGEPVEYRSDYGRLDRSIDPRAPRIAGP